MRISDWSSDVCSSDLQSVAIAHVAQLVRHDASNFFLAQHGKKAALCRDGCIFGIAARGESVGMRAVDYIDLRHGQSCPACELLHQTVKFRSCPAVDLASMVHLEDNLVRIPECEEVHPRRDQKRDHGAAGSAKRITRSEEHTSE